MSYDYMIGVDAIDIQAIISNVNITLKKQVTQAQKAVDGAASLCLQKTQARCPVGTPQSTHKKGYVGGTLKKSYTKQRSSDGLEAIVYTNVLYGKFVELSTYKMKAQPHLYPSFVDGSLYFMDIAGVKL